MNSLLLFISLISSAVCTLLLKPSAHDVEVFNRINDASSLMQNKADISATPNGLFLGSLSKGTKMYHYYPSDPNADILCSALTDPLWFALDVEFALMLRPGAELNMQTWVVKKEIKNILVIDGQSSFDHTPLDLLLFGEPSNGRWCDDPKRIKELCKQYPGVAGFARQYHVYEVAFCDSVHQAGHLETISDTPMDTMDEPDFDRFDRYSKELGQDPAIDIEADSLILITPDHNLRSKESHLLEAREDLRRMLVERSNAETRLYFKHAKRISTRSSGILESLVKSPGNYKKTIGFSFHHYGKESTPVSAQVQQCVSDLSITESFVSNSQGRRARSPRVKSAQMTEAAINSVAEFICSNLISLYRGQESEDVVKEQAQLLIETLKWKQFFPF